MARRTIGAVNDWLAAYGVWTQQWLAAEAGLAGLFLSAFASATVLPGSSEAVLAALLAAYPGLAWSAFAAATAGNVLGGATTFALGHGLRSGQTRLRGGRGGGGGRDGIGAAEVARLQRLGPPALFWSFVPFVGDALLLAGGWMRLPAGRSLAWMAAGKALRYAVLVLAVTGVLGFA